MKDLKKLIYVLLPLQIIVLLMSPRFGWSIHNSDFTLLSYKGTSYENGVFHCLYENSKDTVDISYPNLFSKNFTITVNDAKTYSMYVKIDGASVESEQDMLPGVTNDMVWEDTYGIMFWRCFLTVAMSLVSIKLFRHMMDVYGTERKVLCVGILLIYVIAILISLRVIF